MRRSPLYEVVGQLGMWGMIINGIQAAGLEHHDMTQASWNGKTSESFWSYYPTPTLTVLGAVGLLVAYTAAMFILYTVAPILYRMASSAYYNLSLLSSDFYGLLFGLFLYVRRCSSSFAHPYMLTLYAWAAALLRVLAVFPRLRGRPPRAHYLLLARDAYVPPPQSSPSTPCSPASLPHFSGGTG